MQKISTYLYPNRIQLLADLASFNVEYTNVYQRNVKIYKGVDNVLEFDIKNADQKRIGLVTTTDPVYTPPFTDIKLNVMDAAGNSVGQYDIDVETGVKGIAKVTIPTADLDSFEPQFFHYSVTATKDLANIPLYADSRFGAVGTMELIGSAMPTTRATVVYNTFHGEIDFSGNIINHTSAIPAKFYEAVPTATMDFEIKMTNYVGSIWIEGTTGGTIAVNSFLHATKLQTYTTQVPTTTTITFTGVPVGDFNYFRVSWQNGTYRGSTGTVDSVTI
jgi:hypothetical protein